MSKMGNDGLFADDLRQDVEKKFYLQISRIKLYDYAAQGLIVPDRYIVGEVAEENVESKNKNYLIFSNGYFKDLDEEVILLEIALTDDEKKILERTKVDGVYFWAIPLPITRISQIYTFDEQAQDDILKHSQTYESGSIPSDRFSVFDKDKFTLCKYVELDEYVEGKSYSNEIIKFDKIMGMFAFIKNTNLYYSDQTGIFSNYSDHYFSLLGNFNKGIKSEESKFFKMISVDKVLFDFVNSNQSMNNTYIEELIENTDDKEIKDIFNKLLSDPNSKRKALNKLRDKEGSYFYTCLLYIHRHKDGNQKDNFKSNIVKDIPYDKVEYSLALLGIYYGYSALRASEVISIEDKYFDKLMYPKTNMKFELDTKLDYIAIESIYNFSFHEKKVSVDFFDYLTIPQNIQSITLSKSKEFNAWYDVNRKVDYLGVEYIKITKKSLGIIAKKYLDAYPDVIKLGEYYLTSFVAKYYRDLLSERKSRRGIELYFKQADLLKKLTEERGTLEENELFKVFKLDGK